MSNLPANFVEPRSHQDSEVPSKKRKYQEISVDDADVDESKRVEPKSAKKTKQLNETQNLKENGSTELEALMQEEEPQGKPTGRLQLGQDVAAIASSTGESLILSVNSSNTAYPVRQVDEQVLSTTKDESLKDLLKISEVLEISHLPAVPATGLVKEEDYQCEILDGPNLPILNGDSGISHFGEEPALVQNFYPNKCAFGKKHKDIYLCNQQIFKKLQPDGSIQFAWIWNNLFQGECSFFNQDSKNFIVHILKSGIFESEDSQMWQLKLKPGIIGNETENSNNNNRPSPSELVLEAIPNPKELKEGMNRYIEANFAVLGIGEKMLERGRGKDWSIKQHFNSETKDVSIDKFYQFHNPQTLRKHGLNEQFIIYFKINHLIPPDENPQAVQPYKGLKNEGTTCYLNSLVQTLFFIRAFRNAVYKMPTINGEMTNKKSIPLCLQRIFYNLQLGNQNHVKTFELCHSFGWTTNEINQQQDVNEFNCMFSDQLETQMKDTEVAGTYKNLFAGKLQNVIKCINVDFESTRDEVFNTLQLSVQGNPSIEDSIRQYVAQEKLEGDNQYETEKDGKQDAKKFIRFKELPPVLQISLNRYEFDIDRGMMVKKNQKFKFGDVLDLESVLPAESNLSSQNQVNRLSQSQMYSQNNDNNEKVVNRYHLHSILIHRGTTDFGHYYAFIRPNIDDRWFQFNDLNVREVTKGFAIGQGCGGQSSSFEFQRSGHAQFEGTSGQLLERFQENDTNAYMLIYVRQTEREAIMTDKLSIDDQIPSQLQNHFANEEKFRVQIENDRDATQMNSCYVMTNETLREADWDGILLDTPFNLHQLSQYRFSNKEKSSHLLYVHHMVTINEFIAMLKERFFKDEDQVTLDDIWLYRICQTKQRQDVSVKSQAFHKFTYDLKKRHNLPLFTKQPRLDASQWDSKGARSAQQQWESNNLTNAIYVYLSINPAKLNPRTQKPYQVLSPLNNSEKDQLQRHFAEYVQFITQTDMDNQRDLNNVYEQFSRIAYQFNDVKIRDFRESNKESEYDQIRAHFIFHRPQVGDRESEVTKVKEASLNDAMKEVGDANEEQDGEGGKEDEQEVVKSEKVITFLKKVKVADGKLQQKGHYFIDLNAPLPLKDIAKQLGMSSSSKLVCIVEPQSNSALSYTDQYGKTHSPEQLKKQGLLMIEQEPKTFAIDLVLAQELPAKEFLKGDGAILNFLLEDKDHIKDYAILRDNLVNRVYLTLCMQRLSNTELCFQQIGLGIFEFNLNWHFDRIREEIVARLQQTRAQGNECYQEQVDPENIRLFDKVAKVVSYKDYMRATSNQSSIYLPELLTDQHYLNFMVSELTLAQNDKCEIVRYKYFRANSIRPHQGGILKARCQRAACLKDVVRELQDSVGRDVRDQELYSHQEASSSTYLVAHCIDNSSSAIKGVLNAPQAGAKHPMTAFVLEKGALNWWNQNQGHGMQLLRVTELSDEDYQRIKTIFNRDGFDDIFFSIVQIADQTRNNVGEQFLLPMSKKNSTFGELYRMVHQRLSKIKEYDPSLARAELRGYNLHLAKYHQETQRSRQGRVISTQIKYSKLTMDGFVDASTPQSPHYEFSIQQQCLTPQHANIYDMGSGDWEFAYFIAEVSFIPDQGSELHESDMKNEASNNETSHQMSLKGQPQEEESAQSGSTGHAEGK